MRVIPYGPTVTVVPLWELIFVRADWNQCDMHGDLRRGHAGDLSRFSRTFWGRKEVTP